LIDIASLFRRRPEEILGIDISASAIKLVGLGGSADKPVLECCVKDALPQGVVVDGAIEKPDELAAALRRLVKQSGARTKNVAVALPPSAVITKKLTIPADLPELEMEDQVEAEAKQYIPFPLEDVSLDFFEIGPSADTPGSVEVLIAAARRERVDAMHELLESAGLKPLVVDVSSYATLLALGRVIDLQAKTTPGSLSVLFRIGAHATTIQVLRGQDLVYEREQSVGGSQLTQKISTYYALSLAEAESKKCKGTLAHDYEARLLIPYIDSLVQELGRALQYFFNSTQYNKVNQVLLAGGSALLPGLALAVASHVQVPCSVINPFEGMAVGPKLDRDRVLKEAPAYLGACGLALRRLIN
jgi:type IV pilus assembly protein PilM